MKLIISITLLIYFTFNIGYSQNYLKTDSLLTALNAENIDEQLPLITRLLVEYIQISKDSADLFIKNNIQQIGEKITRNEFLHLTMSVGDAYRNCGYSLAALTYYESSLNISREILNKFREALCLRRIGEIYYYNGIYSESLDNYLKAQKVLQEFPDSMYSDVKRETIISISILYNIKGDNEKALEFLFQTLNNNKLSTAWDSAYAYFNIANSYTSLKAYDKALIYLVKSEPIFKRIGRDDFVTRCYSSFGNIYFLQKDYSNALKYYMRANKTVRKDYTGDRADISGNISAIYVELGQFNEAIQYSRQQYEYASKIKNPVSFLQFWSENLSKIYEGLKDYKSALNYYKRSVAYKDTMNLEEARQKMIEVEMKNDFNSELQAQKLIQKQKDASVSAKMKQQKIMRNFSLGGFILLLFGLFFALRNYNIKRKSNILLTLQKQEINEQKEQIENVHKQVTESIDYAKRIQISILPDESLLRGHMSGHFIMFCPRDKVSGDFYWWVIVEDSLIVAVADCTGHGVPGAFMSMLGISLLREIVTKEYITQPDVILRKLRREVMKALKQEGKEGEQKDGMDIAVISINLNNSLLQFAGANNPLYIIRDGNLTEIKADKMPISIYDRMDKFTNNEFQLIKGDNLYLFSDGFPDQFGGEFNKKFKYKPFQNLLVSIAGKSMDEQKKDLNFAFQDWKKSTQQTDDVLVVGLKI